MSILKKLSMASSGTALMILGLAISSSPASAALLVRSTFQDAALSIDAFGGNSGSIQTSVPTGSSVLQALLYSADVFGDGVAGDVTLNGTFLPSASGTLLTPNANQVNTRIFDVTSFLKPAIESTGGLQNFTISERGFTDGEVLVVAYRNATTTGQTSVILDGELATGGDTTRVNFATPYTGGNFIASFASSYSFQPSGQFTTVDVTTSSTPSRRLTSALGGQDDGFAQNGALITAGGIGDDPTNPANPFATDSAGPRSDDELYNLALGNAVNPSPFIKPGDTFVELRTNNPTDDDNVFGLFLTSSFRLSQVDNVVIPPTTQPPTTQPPTSQPVPEPLTILGSGLALGFGSLMKRHHSRKLKTMGVAK